MNPILQVCRAAPATREDHLRCGALIDAVDLRLRDLQPLSAQARRAFQQVGGVIEPRGERCGRARLEFIELGDRGRVISGRRRSVRRRSSCCVGQKCKRAEESECRND